MPCKYLVPNENKPCKHYIKPGMCSKPELFRCIEYIERFEPILSYSGVNSFMKCPKMFYLGHICGIGIKGQYKSDVLKIGSTVDGYITKKAQWHEVVDGDELWQVKAKVVYAAFRKLVKFDMDSYTGQQEFRYRADHFHITGYLDLAHRDNTHFIELKCSSRPEYYTNPYWIHDQLGTYFLSSGFDYGIIWVIRVPNLQQTGQFKDENVFDYYERCLRDMEKRSGYYFAGYDKEKQVFGIKFYRNEFDLDELKKRYVWVSRQIQQCSREGYYYQNRTQCINPFQCDYLSICDTGGVSDELYEYREKKGGEVR